MHTAKHILLASTAIVFTETFILAYAQENEAKVGEEVIVEVPEEQVGKSVDLLAPNSDNASVMDVVTVTGSRLTDPNLGSVNPITSVDSVDLRKTGQLRLEDALQRVPALSDTGQNDRFSTGQSNLDLRNLGPARTLTLVNGRRFVPGGDGTAAVDINAIPQALIERVDILTGGASSVYGSDATAGVVNFILKDNFEGLELSTNFSTSTEYWDAQSGTVSLAGGKNFADDKGNVAFSYSYSKLGGLKGSDRPFTSDRAEFLDINPEGFDAIPNQVYVVNPPGGGSLFGAVVGADGGLLLPEGVSGLNPDGTDHIRTDRSQSFGLAEVIITDLQPGLENQNFSASSRYEVNKHFNPFVNFYASRGEGRNVYSPGALQSQRLNIDENPFVSEGLLLRVTELQNAAFDGDLDFDFDDDLDFDGDFDVDFDFDEDGDGVDFGDFGVEFGESEITFDRQELERQTVEHRRTDALQLVLGSNGAINDDITYEVTANLGYSTNRRDLDALQFDRYAAAIDVVLDEQGNPVCRSDIDPTAADDYEFAPVSFAAGANSGCIPFNPFTRDLAVNGASYDWIYQNGRVDNTVRQIVLNGYLSGTLTPFGITLPGGDINYVIGAEYRQESLSTQVNAIANELSSSSSFPLGAPQASSAANISTKEVFGEISLPLLSQKGPLLEELTVRGAFRYQDYDPTGSDWSYNAGLIWSPVTDLRLRASLAKATRAPTLTELFAPQFNAPLPISDPCTLEQQLFLGDTPNVSENCEALFTSLGLDLATFSPGTIGGIYFGQQRFGGNPNLNPETSDTYTLGFVANPRFATGLTVSLDYYNIEVSDAISTTDANFIIFNCLSASSLENQFCDLVTRDADGAVANVLSINQNLDLLKNSGYEFQLNYDFLPRSFGQFGFDFQVHHQEAVEIIAGGSETPIDLNGIFGGGSSLVLGRTPEWSVNSQLRWHYDNWSSSVGLNYRDRVLRIAGGNALRSQANTIQQDPYLSQTWNVTLNSSYSFGEKASISVGIDNALNQKPDRGMVELPGSAIGRTLFVGFDYQF